MGRGGRQRAGALQRLLEQGCGTEIQRPVSEEGRGEAARPEEAHEEAARPVEARREVAGAGAGYRGAGRWVAGRIAGGGDGGGAPAVRRVGGACGGGWCAGVRG